jgi:hypothetical protein
MLYMSTAACASIGSACIMKWSTLASHINLLSTSHLRCCCAAGPEEDWEATPADFRGVVTHIKEK